MLLQRSVNEFLFQHLFSVLWDVYPGVELLSHLVILCLIYSGTTKLFSIATAPFYMYIHIPFTLHEGSNFSTFLLTFYIFLFFFFSVAMLVGMYGRYISKYMLSLNDSYL